MHAEITMTAGAALRGPHEEIAEYIGPADYFGRPAVKIRRMAGEEVIPAEHIGTEWRPIPGRVYTHEHEDTGQRWLAVADVHTDRARRRHSATGGVAGCEQGRNN